MKNPLVWIGLLLCLGFVGTGCTKTCKDVDCVNGTCKKGECECEYGWGGFSCDLKCPSGYEGTYCNILTKKKYIRQWSATTTSPQGGTVTHPLYVGDGSAVSTFVISNFNDEGFSFTANVFQSNSFEIFEQNATGDYTGKVSGSGYYNNGKMAINLTKENGTSYFANCNP